MVQIKIDWDEWYPLYKIVDESQDHYYEKIAEISEEDLAFINKATKDFYIAQKMLELLVHPNGY